MTAKEVIKKLKAAGWTSFEGEKHTRMTSPDGSITTTIWRHKGDIKAGTLAAIQRQTGVKLK